MTKTECLQLEELLGKVSIEIGASSNLHITTGFLQDGYIIGSYKDGKLIRSEASHNIESTLKKFLLDRKEEGK